MSNYVNLLSLLWLQHTYPLHYSEYTNFVFCKCSVFRWNLGFISQRYLCRNILQHFYNSEIKLLFWRYLNLRPYTIGKQGNFIRFLVTKYPDNHLNLEIF